MQRKIAKRLFAFLLAVCMLCSNISINAFATEDGEQTTSDSESDPEKEIEGDLQPDAEPDMETDSDLRGEDASVTSKIFISAQEQEDGSLPDAPEIEFGVYSLDDVTPLSTYDKDQYSVQETDGRYEYTFSITPYHEGDTYRFQFSDDLSYISSDPSVVADQDGFWSLSASDDGFYYINGDLNFIFTAEVSDPETDTETESETDPEADTETEPEGNGDDKLLLNDPDNNETTPQYTVSGRVEKEQQIIWYDTNNGLDHKGQLNLTVKVNGNDFTVNWDETQQAYVHAWTKEDLRNLGLSSYSDHELDVILAKLAPLKVTDTGENNLNRTLTASMEKTLSISDEKGTTPILDFSIESIQVNSVNYTGAADDLIQSYAVGKSIQDGGNIPTLYPMTKVDFKFDVRSGNDDPVSVLNQLKDKFSLYLKDSTGDEPVEKPIANNYFSNMGIQIEDVSVGESLSYHLLLPLYDANKQQINYWFECSDDDQIITKTENGKATEWYRVEYDNTKVPGCGTITDKGCEDGTIILIKTGLTDFKFTKVWADPVNTDPSKRPDATYTLWRYSTQGGDYTSAARVEIPLQSKDGTVTFTQAAQDIPKGDKAQNSIEIRLPKELEKYDSDGWPYIYFIRENLPEDSGYEKIFGKVEYSFDEGNASLHITDTLPKDYVGKSSREDDDNSVYDDGTITNHRTEKVSMSITKKWIAAYYQDSLQNLETEMTLYARRKNDVGDGTVNQSYPYETVTLKGFDAFATSKSTSITVDKYDPLGHELEFYWEETSVKQKTKDGAESIAVGAKTSDNNKDYSLPLNEATMDADSYSKKSTEDFTAEVSVEDGQTVITNRLKGTTEYWIRKTWDSKLTPSDVTFYLKQVNANGEVRNYKIDGDNASYTIQSNYKNYTKNQEGLTDSGWILAFTDLPKYDEDGNRYTYYAVEGENGGYISIPKYGYDVDGDGKTEANSVMVTNRPIVEGARSINVRKVWLDDSATTDRAPVYFNIYAENGTLIYGTENAGTENAKPGVLSADPVQVTAATEWMLPADVTLYVTKDGELSKDKVEGSEPYKGGFYIKEVKVGENAVSSTEKTEAGYDTVTNAGTKYAVIYNNSDSAKCSVCTNQVDEDGFYTVTNLRIGTYDLTVEKIWQDDSTVNRSDFTATLTVSCDEDATRITTDDETNLGYAKVHEAVNAAGKTPIIGATDDEKNPVHISATQTLDTALNKQTITFKNLPMYDETGKILHYSIEENVTKQNDKIKGNYTIHAEPMTYTYDTAGTGLVNGTQKITNTFQNTTNIYFDLLWLDDYRIGNQQRPDMYLKLYYTQYQYDANGELVYDENGKPVSEIVRHSFIEYKWDGTNNHKMTEDWWRYTFENLPEYDSHGNKIHYYATVHTHVNDDILDYIAPQYAVGDKVANYGVFTSKDTNQSTVSKDAVSGEYNVGYNTDSPIIGTVQGENPIYVMESENTFVLQLKEDVTVNGHKVWEKLPVGFPVDDLPTVTFKLYQKEGTPAASGHFNSSNSNNTESDNGIPVAAILNYQSPSVDYDFKINYIGINNADGTLVDPNTKVVSPETKKEMTALQYWLTMVGSQSGFTEADYGKPLSKYDGKGVMYKYNIIERITQIKDKIDIAYENLEGVVNGYKITNTFRTNDTNTSPITLTKDWKRNGGDVGSDFAYPEKVVYRLYRFYKIDKDNSYSALELVDTKTMTQATGWSVNFGEQLVYAPNGNPYLYVIAEEKINGYNDIVAGEQTTPTPTIYPMINIPGADTVTLDEGVNAPAMPDTDKNWNSSIFRLKEAEDSGVQATELQNEDTVEYTNNYKGTPQVSIQGSKEWLDYSNAFETRPDVLNLTLYRETFSIKVPQKVADVTITRNDSGLSATVTPVENVNLTSAVMGNSITCTATVNSNNNNIWNFTINYLDGYASTGEVWMYSLKEELPTNYQQTGTELNLKNDIYTSLTAQKVWKDLNTGIAYPAVTVKLQVREGSTGEWKDAVDYFARTPGLRESEYEFTKTLSYSNGWEAKFENLPKGTGIGNSYKKFEYRILETKIGDSEVTNTSGANDSISGTAGNGEYTVSYGTDSSNKTSTATNTVQTTKLTVTKQWENDRNNVYGTRYVEYGKWIVKYHIYRSYGTDPAKVTELVNQPDGKTPYVLTVSGENREESKTATLENLPAYAPNGAAYTYYAVELNPDGSEVSGNRYYGAYEVTYNNGGNLTDGFTTAVTNRLITTELDVKKDWADSSYGKGIRPDNLSLTLWQSSQNVSKRNITQAYGTLSWTKPENSNSWTAKYTDLPKYDNKGAEYQYTVTEKQQAGYQSPVYTTTTGSDTGASTIPTSNITNNINSFMLNKVGGSTELNGVTLVFTSTNQILNTKTGTKVFYQLTWTRDAEGKTTYQIKYGNNKDSCTNDWTSGESAGNVTIYGLPDGTYKLTSEATIPDGYYASALGSTFTLKNGNISTSSPSLNVSDNTISVTNKKTSLNIQKIGENNSPITSGWEFTIEAINPKSSQPTLPTNYTADNKSEWDGKLIVDQVYKMTETQNPDGYVLSNAEVYFKLDEHNKVIITNAAGDSLNGNQSGPAKVESNILKFKNDPFDITVKKTASDGNVPLSGAEFTLYEVGENGEKTGNAITTVKTVSTEENKGTATIKSVVKNNEEYRVLMKTGTTYRLEETKAPDGYILPDTHPYVQFTVASNGTLENKIYSGNGVVNGSSDIDFVFSDDPIALSMVKYDSGDRSTERHVLSGVTFTLKDLTDTTKTDQTATTDTNGQLTFGPSRSDHRFAVIGGHNYTLTETTPRGYESINPITFTVNTNGTFTFTNRNPENVTDNSFTLDNTRKLGSLTITKKDSLSGDELDGVSFKLYRKDTSGNWLQRFIDLITGNNYELTTEFKWGDTSNPATGITITEVKSDGKPSGKLIISGLDWGEYKLVETASSGYLLTADEANRTYTFTVDETTVDQPISLMFNNNAVEGNVITNVPNQVLVYKVEKDYPETKLSGAQYELYRVSKDEKGNEVKDKIDNTTDVGASWNWNSETGIGTAARLPEGTYELVETVPPSGYTIAAPVRFTMGVDGTVTSDDVKVELQNSIPLIYAEDVKTQFSFNKAELYNEQCSVNADDIRPLKGVTFTAYSDEQLTKKVGEATSDTSGEVTFVGLPLGINYIKETATVSGHVLDEHVYTVKVNSEGTAKLMLGGSEVVDNTVVNDVFREDIVFFKVSELNHNQMISGGEYGLYRNGTLIATSISDTDGRVCFDGVLMDVEYTIKELSTPVGSYVSKNAVTLKFHRNENGEIVREILNDGAGTVVTKEDKILWQEPQTVVSILKVDEDGNALKGAKLQIQDLKGKVIPVQIDGKKIESWISGTEAVSICSQLEAGKTYKLVELNAPDGYLIANSMEFKLDDSPAEPGEKRVVTVKMTDDPFDITVKKTTSDGKTALSDAEFTLYALDVNEKIVGDAITTVTTGSDGTATIKSVISDDSKDIVQMKTGTTYRLEETKAPDGYILPDEHPYVQFTVASDGTLTKTYSDNSVGDGSNGVDFTFTDNPISLSMVKYDSGDRSTEQHTLSRVEFTLEDNTNTSNPKQTATTDTNGQLTFGPSGSDHGFAVIGGHSYTLTETRPKGYAVINPIIFTVNTNGTITINDAEKRNEVQDVSEHSFKLYNTRKLGTLTLTKIDSGNQAFLNNVVFRLYREVEPDNWMEWIQDLFTGKNYKLTGKFKWGDTTIEGTNITITPDENGELTISGLDWGSYKLVETASSGYMLTTDEADRTFAFTVDADTVEDGINLSVKDNIISNTPNRLTVTKVDENDHTKVLEGAEYKLYQVLEDKEVEITNTDTEKTTVASWNWNGDTGTGTAARLPVGTYKLVETKSPIGYAIADDIIFTIDEYGVVRINGEEQKDDLGNALIYAEDVKTQFSFNKVELYNEQCSANADDTRSLEGVTFTAYSDKELTKELGQAVSDENGKVTFIGLPLGINYIKETETVAGHVLDEHVYTVDVNSEGDAKLMLDGSELTDNTVVNDVFRTDLVFYKVSELDGTPIAGGEYGLFRGEEMLATCISDEDGRVCFEGVLMDVEYTIRELSTPVGSYISKNAVTLKFHRNEDGEVMQEILSDGEGTVVTEEDKLLWQEPQTVVSILKVDEKGKALKGAVLQIQDLSGNVIPVQIEDGKIAGSWISGTEAVRICGQLEAGETYQLVELKAPAGYQVSEAVKFKLEDRPAAPGENRVVEVTMTDIPTPKIARTGDSGNIVFWMGLTAASVIVMILLGVCLFRKRRRK